MKWGNISTNIATLEKIAGMGLFFFSYRVTFTADRCKLKTTAIRPINATGPYIFFLEMKFPMIVTKDLPDTVEVK